MAVRFDSSTDEYNASNGALGTGDFTVTLWVKRVTDRNNYSTPICLDGNNANNVIALQTDTDGVSMYCWVAAGGTAQDIDTFTAATPAATWISYALVRSGTTLTVMRGTESGTTDNVSGTIGSINITHIRLGDSVSASEWWNGSVANVKVYSVALTQTEVETEWGNWQRQRTSNTVRHHKFQSGTSTADDSGNGNTLTSVGTPANDTTAPTNPSIADSPPGGGSDLTKFFLAAA